MIIEVGKGYECLIDDEDLIKIGHINWRVVIAPSNMKPYVYHPNFGMMSRIIMNTPTNLECDHIDGNTLNNRKSNLRNCTPSQNLMNKVKYAGMSSKYKGVSWYRNQSKWRARINWDGKTILLGYFELEIDAAVAYNEKAKELYGDFAVLNQIFSDGQTEDEDEEN